MFYRKSGGTAEFEFTHFVPYGTECFLIYIERNFEMREKLEEIKKNALDVLQKATDIDALEEARIKFLGKKGELTAVLKGMGQLSKEERPQIGALANEIRGVIENHIDTKKAEFSEKLEEIKLKSEVIDVTMPGKAQKTGKLHPLTKVMNNIKDTFIGMGFEIAEGPEVELDYYNFEALNIPPNHPARDTQDTFYINENTVLRTQTSPIQVRVMEKKKPPIRIIAPGRVYRSDAVDATHSPVFHQIEGLVVDKGVTMADLKGTLEMFIHRLYGENTKVRFRPHHFPFTEPSAEVDVSCFACGGKGCSVCKHVGWIEVMPGGSPHPNVLRAAGLDPDEYTGFYVNIGLDRLVMMRYGVDDVRLFHSGDLRFLRQFR